MPGELLEDKFEGMTAVEKRIAVKKRLGYNLPKRSEYFDLPDLYEKTIFDEIDRSLHKL